ncbi:hypothetical protein GYMLUDRAFT_237760 [Collybiopsis luxurians FD-317 M1]|nr:hypothetical protein GYMLUDRAFT_237760 [Collybiopsis luxurians FD-317 M1]
MNNITYSQTELTILKSIVSPSNRTLYKLVQKATNYQRLQFLASAELEKDRPRFTQLHAEVEAVASTGEHPHLLSVIQPRTSAQSPRPFFAEENPDYSLVQQALKQVDDYLKQEPKDFNDYFWRWFYSTNAFFIHSQYCITLPLQNDINTMLVYLKFSNQVQPCVSGQAPFPELNELPLSRGCRGEAAGTSRSRSRFTNVLSRSPFTKISDRRALKLMDDVSVLSNYTFGLVESNNTDPEKLIKWKVVAVDFARGQYTIEYYDMPGSRASLSKEETLATIKSSVHLVV